MLLKVHCAIVHDPDVPRLEMELGKLASVRHYVYSLMYQHAVNQAVQSTNYCAYVLVNVSKLKICLEIEQYNTIYCTQNFEPWLLALTFLSFSLAQLLFTAIYRLL